MVDVSSASTRTVNDSDTRLARFEFRSGRNSAHMARTLMLSELARLLEYVNSPVASREEYHRAILEDNCLGKRSGTTRKLDWKYLTLLYGLDPSMTLFRTMRWFWERDEEGRPLLALACAQARDPLLRASGPFILAIPEGQIVTRQAMERFLESLEPHRFRRTTLSSTAKNLNSTWTQTGHVSGRAFKVRARAQATAGSSAYALLLGYLQGLRGQLLFESDHMKLLDCSVDRTFEMAEYAAGRGWLSFKRIGNVRDVTFPGIRTPEEVEWGRE